MIVSLRLVSANTQGIPYSLDAIWAGEGTI
jgi:hypothetical protein